MQRIWRFLGLFTFLTLMPLPALQAIEPANPSLTATVPGVPDEMSQFLSLSRAHIAVGLWGHYAETNITLTIENGSDDDLEAKVRFRMLPGSVLTGYALDIDEVMVVGVLVEKEKAKKIFEDTVRAGVDPGLAEQVGPDTFETRVYPVEGHGQRAVRLSFVSYLGRGGSYRLPFITDAAIEEVSMSIALQPGARLRDIRLPKGLEGEWRFEEEGARNGWFEGEDISFKSPIMLKLAHKKRGMVQMASAADGNQYFVIDDKLPKAGRPFRPKSVRIYWDTSLSRAGQRQDEAYDLIEAVMTVAKARTLEIIPFATGAASAVRFKGQAMLGDARAFLDGLTYGGASNIAAAMAATPDPADLCLIFTDGNATLMDSPLAPAPCVLHAIAEGPRDNLDFMHYLASQNGGDVHVLANHGPAALAKGILTNRMRPRALTAMAGAMLYSLPAAEGRVRLIGKVNGQAPMSQQPLAVTFGNNTGQSTVRHYSLDRVTAGFDGLRALWAKAAIEDMYQQPVVDHAAIVAMSRLHGIETKDTSFLVLEDMEAYVDAGLEPPADLPDLDMDEYQEYRDETSRTSLKRQQERLEEIRFRWEDMQDWWQTDFSRVPEPDPKTAFDTASAPAWAPTDMESYSPSGRPAVGTDIEEVIVSGTMIQSGDVFTIEPWQPDRPYIKTLEPLVGTAGFDAAFYAVRKQHGTLPVFYFDVADLLYRKGLADAAADMALNVLELEAASGATKVILAGKLLTYGASTRAVWLYETIVRDNDMLPQPRRMLALALVRQAEETEDVTSQQSLYARALDLLYQVVMTPWDADYDGVEMIALMEANQVAARLRALGVAETPFPAELMTLFDVDLRIVISWNTDGSDMDLWVEEPSGETAMFSHPLTRIGGHMSDDMTQGFGPEEYMIHRAPDGKYRIFVHYYASDALRIDGPISMRIDLFRNYGRAGESHQVTEVELDKAQGSEVEIGDITIGLMPVIN